MKVVEDGPEPEDPVPKIPKKLLVPDFRSDQIKLQPLAAVWE